MTQPTEKAQELRAKLIRNFNEVELKHEYRAPLYDTRCAPLLRGTAAQKLGMGIDILAPGMRSCPYHLHYAQEECFVVLEGEGTLRVAGEMIPIKSGDVIATPAGPEYPHHIINTSNAPLKYLSISTREMPEICEYPDSDKYLAYTLPSGPLLNGGRMHRAKDDLDYWDGEQ
jgi:uncharacterized cupin superfamily protein